MHQGSNGFYPRPERAPPVEIVFRLLVPTPLIGMVLGRNGDIIKQIRFDTGARVNISSDAPGKSNINSPYRAVKLLADPAKPCRSLVDDHSVSILGKCTSLIATWLVECLPYVVCRATRKSSDSGIYRQSRLCRLRGCTSPASLLCTPASFRQAASETCCTAIGASLAGMLSCSAQAACAVQLPAPSCHMRVRDNLTTAMRACRFLH